MVLEPDREAQLHELACRLGIEFVELDLLSQAFRHSSYINENDLLHFEGNERLEFLGDSVLGLIVTDEIYRRYRDKREGELSKVKAMVVSRRVLAKKADEIELGRYVQLGRGEELTGGRSRRSILSNTFESLVGAIFLSGGIHFAHEFVLRYLNDEIEKCSKGRGLRDHKSELQEVAQREWGKLPLYRVVEVVGPDHDKLYKVEVLLDGTVLGGGQGKSKKSAQQAAARQALECLDHDQIGGGMEHVNPDQ